MYQIGPKVEMNTSNMHLDFKIMAFIGASIHEQQHNKTNKMTCAPSKDSDQPVHLPKLIRVFAARSMGS